MKKLSILILSWRGGRYLEILKNFYMRIFNGDNQQVFIVCIQHIYKYIYIYDIYQNYQQLYQQNMPKHKKKNSYV